MSTEGSCVSDAMRDAVGREISRKVSYPVSESDIRRWAIAVYYPEPPPRRFIDAAVAAKSRWGGIVAPEDFNPFAWASAESDEAGDDLEPNDPDRNEKILGIAGPGLKNQLNGGLESDYGAPMRPGDVITSVATLAGYQERQGRLGLMLFTYSEDLWTNQNGETVRKSRRIGIRYGRD